ncbi:IS110 family transposase [Roseibium litorale]|uniref:IS110 family transposase n=1 Tax=Roseibium litorale TaxID=2803841 RepID=A0ABR9CU31_9HYPH|nr:IS110 family transposase [Roseibium litorale]MBD8894377.1 IS110 family transposase [Roseibium litorale]
MTLHQTVFGCDISKAFLDIFDPRTRRFLRIGNTSEEIEAFLTSIKDTNCCLIMEATGVHDRKLRHALATHGIAFSRLNPLQARRFAELRGQFAKTDRIDAEGLSAFGAIMKPAVSQPPCAERERLAALARRRDQLVELRALEKRHRAEADDPFIVADLDAVLATLNARIALIEAEIDHYTRSCPDLAEHQSRLISAPGIGKITALTLVAHMPELGTLPPKKISALAGLAPFNDDSGPRRGRKHIRGGRRRVRNALYMAALGAIRANTRFKLFFQAIANRSGSKKLALIAVARKLLTVLNAMLRDKRTFA